MIPVELLTQYGILSNKLNALCKFFESRLTSDLSYISPIRVSGRVKAPDSILQKLGTGKYRGLADLWDLIGVTVVVLHRREVQEAVEHVKGGGLIVIPDETREIQPTDFRYREPKLYLKPPPEYLDRNPEVKDFVTEVQFTSALQHALDMTTHDFDYKGRAYSWRNFRLVAQLRGMLELVDGIIDDIENVALSGSDDIYPPAKVVFAGKILDILSERLAVDKLPDDRRRFADTVAKWVEAAGIGSEEFSNLLTRHADLLHSSSLDATSAVLGALLREHGPALLAAYDGNFVVGSELESLCAETSGIIADRRVRLSWPSE
jgi:ppGpp synthetase/RelA/SpoT-type nucleotidyltranferase